MRFVKYKTQNVIHYQIFDDDDEWCHSYMLIFTKNTHGPPGTLIDGEFFVPRIIPFNEDDIQDSFNRVEKLKILL